MKNLSIFLLLLLLLTGCSSKSDETIQIDEKLFIAQTNDIYNNLADYTGKTIHYEGIFTTMFWEEQNITIPFVLRYGPGCCGNDGEAGFEISLIESDWPEENAWVEVTGIIENVYDETYDYEYPVIQITSIIEKKERGQEFVSA